MNIRELIERLSAYDAETQVQIQDVETSLYCGDLVRLSEHFPINDILHSRNCDGDEIVLLVESEPDEA